jgi:hypothetical protein
VRKYQRDKFSGWPAVGIVTGLLFLWALLLSVGTLKGGQFVAARPLIVIASMAIFSGVWILAMLLKNRSNRR